MRLHGRPTAGAALCAALAALIMIPAPARGEEAKPSPLQATLEILRPFTYDGEPLMVRLAVFNTGEQPFDNAAGINLIGGLKVAAASGAKLTLKPREPFDPKRQPAVIAPGGFFGVIEDIARLVPDLAKAGTYTLSWENAGLNAPAVTVKVLPKFDPSESYVAVIETDYGYLEFALKTKEAPKHVQNFYNLALLGFYDNTVIHQVIKGVEIRGGDPTSTGGMRLGYAVDREIAPDLRHKRGTLSSMPIPGKNVDDASQFVITLSPHEAYDGALSILGELRRGDDVLQAIEAIPTTGQRDQPPYFRPLSQIVIRSVTVKKASEIPGGSGR